VIGKLLRVWDWFDDQSVDGYAPVALAPQLNRNTGVSGFVDAMQQVGWIAVEDNRLMIPNFARHNGQTAKDRALSAKRMAKSRGNSCGAGATSTATPPQPEKRREEKRRIEDPPNPQGGRDDGFLEILWNIFPPTSRTRSSKKQVATAWGKTPKKPEQTMVFDMLRKWAVCHDWTKDGGQFAPGAHLWIQHRKWESEPLANQPKTSAHAGYQENLEIPIIKVPHSS
jgi:hypothetical protein